MYCGEDAAWRFEARRGVLADLEEISTGAVRERWARELRRPYLEWIAELGARNDSFEWWSSPLAAKNVYAHLFSRMVALAATVEALEDDVLVVCSTPALVAEVRRRGSGARAGRARAAQPQPAPPGLHGRLADAPGARWRAAAAHGPGRSELSARDLGGRPEHRSRRRLLRSPLRSAAAVAGRPWRAAGLPGAPSARRQRTRARTAPDPDRRDVPVPRCVPDRGRPPRGSRRGVPVRARRGGGGTGRARFRCRGSPAS